jgi:DNA repair exonuclease SbcCD ATPase subunit
MPPEGTVAAAADDDATPDPTQTDAGNGEGAGEGGDAGADTGAAAGEGSKPDDSAASGDDTGEGGTGEGEGTGEGAPSGKKGAYARLLEKYGGDEDKLAEGVWNQANSLSEMSSRLDEITDLLKQSPPEPEVPVEQTIADDPYVRQAAEEVRSIDQRIKEADRDQVQIVAEHGKLERLVNRLEGQLEGMDDENPKKSDIRDQLREARTERKEAARNYRESKRDIDTMQRELQQAAMRFRKAENDAKERVERDRNEVRTRAQRQAASRSEFTDAVRAEAKKYGIPEDSQTFKVLHESIQSRVVAYLRTLPKGSPGIDYDAAVEDLMEEYVEAMDLKSRFQQSSTRKRKAAGDDGKSGTGIKATTEDLKKGKEGTWTADYARQRAKQLLGG